METKDPSFQDIIGLVRDASDVDIAKIRAIYGCSGAAQVSQASPTQPLEENPSPSPTRFAPSVPSRRAPLPGLPSSRRLPSGVLPPSPGDAEGGEGSAGCADRSGACSVYQRYCQLAIMRSFFCPSTCGGCALASAFSFFV